MKSLLHLPVLSLLPLTAHYPQTKTPLVICQRSSGTLQAVLLNQADKCRTLWLLFSPTLNSALCLGLISARCVTPDLYSSIAERFTMQLRRPKLQDSTLALSRTLRVV